MSDTNNILGCKKKEEKPQCNPGITEKVDGITYFKLKFDEGNERYFGDHTKNCGLYGEEIDRNFFFLRNAYIYTAYTEQSGETKFLVLERVSGEKIYVDITDEDNFNHDFIVSGGSIYVKYPGTDEWLPFIDAETGLPAKFVMEGECPCPEIKVATDATIDGDGTCANPLSVDLAYRTGTYEPADHFIDLTCSGTSIEMLPKDLGPGHAIITKEISTKFGCLYNYWEVEKLMAELAKNEDDCDWRVPTSEDWGKLLDWAEGCVPECQNHNADINNPNRGCQAGARLKSTEYWEEKEGCEPDNQFGFSIYPVGMSPNTTNAKETAREEYTGINRVTAFWSQTEAGNEEHLVRVFSYAHNDVKLAAKEKNEMLSLRLVKDVPQDASGDTDPGYVYILGNYVPVIRTTDGTQLWTALNVGFTNYSGFDSENILMPEEWEDLDSEIVFYYNVWDAKANLWRRKQMTEGESVAILYEDLESPCGTGVTTYVTEENKNHEWRIFVNPLTGEYELIDIFADIWQAIHELQSGLTELSGTVIDNELVTAAALNDLNSRLIDTDGRVSDLESDVEELKNRSLETDESITLTNPEHGVTRLEVHIDTTNTEEEVLVNGGQTKLGTDGIYFDGDFKLDTDEDDE